MQYRLPYTYFCIGWKLNYLIVYFDDFDGPVYYRECKLFINRHVFSILAAPIISSNIKTFTTNLKLTIRQLKEVLKAAVKKYPMEPGM